MKNLSLVLLLTLWALASCQKAAYGTYTIPPMAMLLKMGTAQIPPIQRTP